MGSIFLRQADYHYIVDRVLGGACCSIVGLSNTGKSILLRDLAARTGDSQWPAEAPEIKFVYVDCNLMLAATDQGFYEAVLRSLRENLAQSEQPGLLEELDACYQKTVQSESPFLVSLGFNEAIMKVCQMFSKNIVLLLDEFDEAYVALESRVFLNLRALHDKYRGRLVFVTATVKPLREIRTDPTSDEFRELFTHNERHLSMLTEPDSRALLTTLANRHNVTLDEDEMVYVRNQAGGHPGLMETVAQLPIRIEAGAPGLYRQQGLELVTHQLDESEIAQGECIKLWHQLSEREQSALLGFVVGGAKGLPASVISSLQKKGILTGGKTPRIFGERFAAFVRRRRRTESDYPEGIWLDVDAGDVWVDGRQIPTLTDLEYRLLQTLYGRMDKLCDKYLIVESVWGQEYIDVVDDARIEKLISRLRSKIEINPGQPRHLITVRGRGYKLLEHAALS